MRWLARTFANALVRRLAYALAALFLAWVGIGRAQAATYQDQGEAFAICGGHLAAAQKRVQQENAARGDNYWAISRACVVDPAYAGSYTYICSTNHGSSCAAFIKDYSSPQGGAESYSWLPGNTCASRNSAAIADAALAYSLPATCIAGCKMQGESFTQSTGGVTVYGMRARSYDGTVCTKQVIEPQTISQIQEEGEDAKQQKQPECLALGSGQTACMKPNGDHCTTSSKGKTFCWTPTETGQKVDAGDAQTKTIKDQPVKPPTMNIEGQEPQRTEGHQQTACINNTCTTFNVTNFSSVPSGQAKNSTGNNTTDGSGNTSGNGAPSKGSEDEGDDGDKDSATDSGNCTTPPVCVGDTLKCLHLKFTWKSKCNTTPNEITNGSTCDNQDIPVCAGESCKAERYAQVLQQWRSRCEAKAVRDGIEGLAGQGDGDDGTGSVFVDDDNPVSSLDQSRVTYGGGQIGYSFAVEGQEFKLPQQVLDFLPILKFLIIAGAALVAFWIIRGNS